MTEAPTFQEMAQETDRAVREMVGVLGEAYPDLRGAIVAGLVGALTRFQLGSMPAGSTSMQVLQAINPVILACASQAIEARQEAAGISKAAPIGVISNDAALHAALTRHLTEAPVATYAIHMADKGAVVLVSIGMMNGEVATYGSIPSPGAIKEPSAAIRQHVSLALASWRGGPLPGAN
jgi:hypothetical protein